MLVNSCIHTYRAKIDGKDVIVFDYPDMFQPEYAELGACMAWIEENVCSESEHYLEPDDALEEMTEAATREMFNEVMTSKCEL